MDTRTTASYKDERKESETGSIKTDDIAQVYSYAKMGMEQEVSYIMSSLKEAPYYNESISYIDQGASLSIPTSVVTDVDQLKGFKDTVAETYNEAEVEMSEVSPTYLSVIKTRTDGLLRASNIFIQVLEDEGVKNFEDIGLTKEEILAKEMDRESEFEEEKDIF